MSKKLAAKASLIQLPPMRAHDSGTPVSTVQSAVDEFRQATPAALSPAPGAVPGTSVARPKTAPGSMAVFMGAQSAAIREAEELKSKLKSFDGAVPVRALNPKRIRPSRWANRHEDGLSNIKFMALRSEIAAAGKNIQPIRVRPVVEDADFDYELVYGHRRHRACLDLDLPVYAVIEDMDDRALYEAMERENRERANLSAWEQGMTYRRALDEGLYPSQRKLAEAIGLDVSLISKSLALARLPETVVGAFSSPLDIQFRWAQPLSEVLQKDPEGLVNRAKIVSANRGSKSAKQILEELLRTGTDVLNGSTPARELRIGKVGEGAVLATDLSGRAILRFDKGVLNAERHRELLAWLQSRLSETDGKVLS